MRAIVIALVLALCAVVPARAVQPDEMLADPKLETQARALSAELRCMVCQNQSIDDSDAPLAHDIRVLIRERLLKGDNEEAIKFFLVSRYGDFILLKPPFKAETLLLWGGAPFILIAGAAFLIAAIRRKGRAALAPAPLTSAEQQRVTSLMNEPEN
jgi:cytochrome c-type biogenesis protein CcmH